MKLIVIALLILPKLCFSYYLTTGTYVPYFNKAQVNDSGDTQKFDLNPYFSIGEQFPISSYNFFSPEFGYSFFLENAKNTKVSVIFIHYTFSYIINNNFIFRYGLTNNWYRIKGEGGTVSLKNGNSTKTFPSPDKTITSYFTTLDFGMEYIFANRKYSTRFDLQSMGFKNYDNSVYNYLLTANFYY